MSYNFLDLATTPWSENLSLSEAAEIWEIDESTIRKAIASGKLVDGQDCRKFGKQWVITEKAMAREFRGGHSPWSCYLANLRKKERYQEN